MPDVPKACVRCGTQYGLTRQPLLVRFGSNRMRFVDLPFCPKCWLLHESTRSVVFVAVGVALAVLIIGISVAVVARDWMPGIAGLVIGLGCVLAALVIRRNALPVVRQVGETETVLEVPGVGEVRIRMEE